MRLSNGLDGLRHLPPGAIVSVGNFDGIHLGHQRILATARALRTAAPGSKLAVVTFEPHPLTVLRPQAVPPRLTPVEVKQKLLERYGVDELVILPPTPDVLGLKAETFWEILRDQARVAHLVEGASFNFGKGRGGNVQRLREWSAGTAVQLHVIEQVSVALLDQSVVGVSSSLIRWLLAYGRARDAAICLGRPYALVGEVIRGHQRGRTIGIPTANLNCDHQFIPADGVYTGRCEIDGVIYPAALSIGSLPTFGDSKLQIEAHLIGYAGDLYGKTIQVDVIDWLRDQWKFDGIEALKKQLAIDLAEIKARAVFDPSRQIARIA